MKFEGHIALEMREAFFKDVKHESELATDDPLRVQGRRLGDLFTRSVDFLRTRVPNPAIRTIAVVLWDLVGHKVVPIAIGPRVDSVSFLASKEGSNLKAQIILPLHWEEMCQKDPLMQFGAVLVNGSRAVDIYNGKDDFDEMHRRAIMYEAEFLITFRRDAPPIWEPNEYQRSVLKEFPEGINSEKAKGLFYESRPFVVPS